MANRMNEVHAIVQSSLKEQGPQHLPQAFARMGSRQVMGKLVLVNA